MSAETDNLKEILNDLVLRVAYMFYDTMDILIITQFLEKHEKVSQSRMNELVPLPTKKLNERLVVLKTHGILGSCEEYVFPAGKDASDFTKREREKYKETFFYINFKTFLDWTSLRIRLIIQTLEEKSGGNGAVSFQCPQCQEIYSSNDILPEDDYWRCPNDHAILEKLDITHSLNKNAENAKKFKDITKPILDTIDRIASLIVVIDDPDKMCNPDSLETHESFREKKRKHLAKKTRSSSYFTQDNHKFNDQSKISCDGLDSSSIPDYQNLDSDVQNILKVNKQFEKSKIAAEPTFQIDGNKYSISELKAQMHTFDDETYQRAFEFLLHNQQ